MSAASGTDHDLRVRFFNTRKEAPFVGHATIAAHAVLLALGRRDLGVVRQASGTGIVEVHAAAPDGAPPGGGPLIEFRQTLPELDNPLPFKTTLRVAEALRLPATSLDEVMPARIARKGSSRLLVPVATARALEVLAPNFDTLLSIGHELGTDGFFVFASNRGSSTQGMRTESRMFCPALGIPEDPASGNAHAMLASYLFEIGQFGKHSAGFSACRDATCIGRPRSRCGWRSRRDRSSRRTSAARRHRQRGDTRPLSSSPWRPARPRARASMRPPRPELGLASLPAVTASSCCRCRTRPAPSTIARPHRRARLGGVQIDALRELAVPALTQHVDPLLDRRFRPAGRHSRARPLLVRSFEIRLLGRRHLPGPAPRLRMRGPAGKHAR